MYCSLSEGVEHCMMVLLKANPYANCDFPYNGEVKIRDILDQTTTNIGHIENIDKLYQFACHQY